MITTDTGRNSYNVNSACGVDDFRNHVFSIQFASIYWSWLILIFVGELLRLPPGFGGGYDNSLRRESR